MMRSDRRPADTFGRAFRLTLITNDPRLAAEADEAGVNRIGVDLEHLGKVARQAGHDTRISRHGWDDLAAVAHAVRRADLFARINPVHYGTEAEVDAAVRLGAAVLMLPNFESAAEVATFVAAVGGRARVVILVERVPAAARIREILSVDGLDEVMIGLNDLHMECRLANSFEALTSPLVDMMAAEVHATGRPLAIGGVGRIDDLTLPVPADLVLAQYPRLDATGAWLSRSFVKATPDGLGAAVGTLRARLDEWSASPPDVLARAREDLAFAARAWRHAGREDVRSFTDPGSHQT
jgi:hypothetical protein